jgi:tRNA(Ile2) C34 agmatinyltransferase TiaS
MSIPSEGVEKVVRKLCANDNVKMAGLGARDSLRLEAGLCLYGARPLRAAMPACARCGRARCSEGNAHLSWQLRCQRACDAHSEPGAAAQAHSTRCMECSPYC